MHLKPKTISGHKYWYIEQRKWEDGESQVDWQIYLGNAEKILEMYNASKKKFMEYEIKLKTFNMGRSAAFLMAAEELGFYQIIEKVVGKRKGPNTAELMLIMTAGRNNGPLSKVKTVEWYGQRSVLPFILDLPKDFTEDTLYYTMDKLDTDTREAIGDGLCRNLLEKGITPSLIYEDTTNFATHIEHGEDLPKKGRSKEGKHNKNLVGMAMAVSDQDIPVLIDTYAGNRHDADVFPETMKTLIRRLERLDVDTEDLVLVFDKGNNSKDNIDMVRAKFHIIASVKRNQAPELMEVPLSEYEYLYETYEGYKVQGYSTKREFFGREWNTVVSYNPGTARKQKKTYEKKKKVISKFLDELAKKVGRKGKGKKTTPESALKQAAKKIPNDYTTVFKPEISTEKNWFRWKLDEEAEKTLYKRFGRQIIITDLDDPEEWTPELIVKGYNGKVLIEEDIKTVRNWFILPFFPVRHRKDSRIEAHVFLCGIGLTFLRYVMYKLRDTGLSIYKVLEALDGLNISLTKEKGTKHVKWVVNQMDIVQSIIFNKLDLHRFIPTRTKRR